jgi:hypothetical protein
VLLLDNAGAWSLAVPQPLRAKQAAIRKAMVMSVKIEHVAFAVELFIGLAPDEGMKLQEHTVGKVHSSAYSHIIK